MPELPPVPVPAAVKRGIDRVRESGKTNMFGRKAVQWWANEFEEYATVVWLEDHKAEYWAGLARGFVVEP